MKQQKQHRRNKQAARLALLGLLLAIGIVSLSVGNAWARYQEIQREQVTFQVREPDQVLLGTIQEEVFLPVDEQTNPLVWHTVEHGVSLEFAVANGSSKTLYSAGDQVFRLSMFGSLGVAKDGVPLEVSVTYAVPGEEETYKMVWATATAIGKGTALNHSYGDGWLYRFYEETADGMRELTWELPGGSLNYVTLTVLANGTFSDELSLLQPLVSAETITN